MAYFRQQGFGSKLLRRVQRHRAMTALFRSPAEPEVPLYPAQPQAMQSGMPVVQASLALPQVAPETDVPVVQVSPRPFPPVSRPPQAPTPFVPIPLPNTASTAEPPAPSRPVQRQTPPTPPAITPAMPVAESATLESPAPKPVTEDSDSTITEDVWRRLTTISRKHREKQAEETEQETQQTIPEEVVVPTPPARPERGVTEMPSNKPKPAPVQRSQKATQAAVPVAGDKQQSEPIPLVVTGQASSTETTIEGTTSEPVPSPTIRRTPVAKPASETPGAIETGPTPVTVTQTAPPVAQREATPDTREAAVPDTARVEETADIEVPSEAQVEQVPLIPTREKAVSPEPSIVTPDTEVATPVTAQTPAATISRSEEDAPTEPVGQEEPPPAPAQAPLEQALAAENAFGFQVTRKPQTPVQAQPAVKQLPSAPRQVDDANHRELHAALQNVEAGRPTDSSIEVIPPRRPRPGAVMHAPRIQRMPQASESVATETSDHITTQIAEAPTTVETPIGPLPSDLWTLIDAPIPQATTPLTATQSIAESRTRSAPPRVQAQVPTQAPSIAATPIQRLVTQTETPDITGVQRTPQAAPVQTMTSAPFIQRAVEEQQATSQVEERPAQTSDDTAQAPTSSVAEHQDETQEQQEEQTPTAGETDLDALAAQVYKRIKRKLSIEWERLRSRF